MLKTIPYYFYQVDAIEDWLDEQAQKGLFPLETRFGTAMSFRRDTPRAVRYRIDVKRNIGYTDEKARIAAYREMGWEYVCDLTPYLDIYRCDDPAAPELNTDEETLHQVLDRRLRSDIRRGCAGILFAVVWCGWNLYEALRIDGGLYSSLLSGYALVALCWVLLGGFWLVRLVAAIRAAETTQQRILLTRDYHCPATVRRNLRLHWATNLMLALALVIIAVLWITLDRSRDNPPCRRYSPASPPPPAGIRAARTTKTRGRRSPRRCCTGCAMCGSTARI